MANQGTFLLSPPDSPQPAALAFLRYARFLLRDDYPVKIAVALAELTAEQIWRRPNDASNSAGNLILHLAGNARQWIVAGVDGQPDTRHRAAEFDERRPIAKEDLLQLLRSTLHDVDGVLAKLESEVLAGRSDAPLQRIFVPQGYPQTVLDAIFHVVEHFSYHTGQILMLAKWHAAGRIHLYDDSALNS